MKKFLALSLAILMIFALVGCKGNQRQVVQLTLSTQDSEAILAAAGILLPPVEEAKGANSTVDWFGYEDPFHNYAEDEIISTGYWTFVNKYGGEVNWVETTYENYNTDLAASILSSDAPDFTGAGAGMYPNLILQGLFAPVNDYIDYDDPLWEGTKDFAYEYTSMHGLVYTICTDIQFGQIVAYNRRVVDEWGFDDPAELYYNDEWTWDKFYEMCAEFTDPDEGRWAVSSWSFPMGIMDSTGTQVVYYDGNVSAFVSNYDDPRLERAANLLYDMAKNDMVYPWWSKGGLMNGTEGGGIKDGNLLFYLRHNYCIIGPVDDMSNIWGDIAAGELMFAPVPRDDDGDGKYYLNSYPAGYSLVKGGDNHEGVALLAACERFKVIDPTVISIDEKQLREIYLWNDEMMDMWDICKDIVNNQGTTVYEYSLGSKLSAYVDNLVSNANRDEPSTWASLKEANAPAIDHYVGQLNEQIADMSASE